MIYLKLANLEDAKAEYEALQKIPAAENGLNNEYADMSETEFVEQALPKMVTRGIKGKCCFSLVLMNSTRHM